MLLLDSTKNPVTRHETLDLRKLPEKASDPQAVWITRGHEPGAFGIDPHDYFM